MEFLFSVLIFFFSFFSFFFVWEVVLCLRQHAMHAMQDDVRGFCNAGVGDDSYMLATLSVLYSTLLYLPVSYIRAVYKKGVTK